MKLKNLNVRLVKLPPDIELILYMIKEELKSTKLFNGVARVGLDDYCYQSHFGTVVLAYMGFDERPDDLHEFYMNLIDKYSEKIEADNDVIIKCAFDVYTEMMIEKKKRNAWPINDLL
jgi:hypothetical protein